MDPNETTPKLLNQDPFHEVNRKRAKKEPLSNKASTESRKHMENKGQGSSYQMSWDRNARIGGYPRNASRGISQQFRVVRDNRLNQNTNGNMKPVLLQCSTSANEQAVANIPPKSSPGILTDEKHSDARKLGRQPPSQASKSAHDSGSQHAGDANSGDTCCMQALAEEARGKVLNSAPRAQGWQPHIYLQLSAALASTDPVHVPSPDSRSSDAGVVGIRHQFSGNPVMHSSVPNGSFSNPCLGKGDSTTGLFGQSSAITKGDQISRSFFGSKHNSKLHQPVGHHKASQSNMEWKPKSSQKSSLTSTGMIGTATITVSSPTDSSPTSMADEAHLLEKLSQVNISKNQHVIIPQHLRVPEADCSHLIFGSFAAGFNSAKDFLSGPKAFGNSEVSKDEPAVSISLLIPVTSTEDVYVHDEVDILEDHVRTSFPVSPASDSASEHQLRDKKESSNPRSMDNYADIELVGSFTRCYTPEEPQQQQDPPSLPSFSALSLHGAKSVTPSTEALVQQQHTQLYPEVHISHFPNFIPYRRFLSPVYVPPMSMPSYSSNPAYPHPTNGSSYLLMSGGSSHLNVDNLKYPAAQYKPVTAGGPTGLGNYTNLSGYTISAPGTVGGVTGLEDAMRVKYKESNLYFPNRQAETSEIWIQSPRDLVSLQSAQYHNLSGQAPHAAYMPSYAGHASFSSPMQSAHVPFTGLYHPPQSATIANHHHQLVNQQMTGMCGNVGVGLAVSGAGAYQQSQVGQLNWTGNI
ncbi:GBF-interacting protein 1-like isoform X2 [Magnolia sinica]|uniref:GBF-interacting protein 1-like isoform X2 n=1 Tax=Magnolia sinica TaxID=86752 RepID=UPI00265B1762|nr:GBF-interacting protein 1-like isoform X2 [Magnolia sinica]